MNGRIVADTGGLRFVRVRGRGRFHSGCAAEYPEWHRSAAGRWAGPAPASSGYADPEDLNHAAFRVQVDLEGMQGIDEPLLLREVGVQRRQAAVGLGVLRVNL